MGRERDTDRDREEMLAEGQLTHPAGAGGREIGKFGGEKNRRTAPGKTLGLQKCRRGGTEPQGVREQAYAEETQGGGLAQTGPCAHMYMEPEFEH